MRLIELQWQVGCYLEALDDLTLMQIMQEGSFTELIARFHERPGYDHIKSEPNGAVTK